MSATGGFGVYVHWPYCARVCPYCDFNVVRERGREAEKAALVQAILADLRAHAALTGPRTLTSVFLGGGTPSLMSPEAVAEIVAEASRLWSPAPDLEVTLEANPADLERFAAFAQAGVNRLSLGVQAFDDEALRFLGRDHDAATARRAVATAAHAFPRVSLDLIYALPGQSMEAWKRELAEVAALPCEHISAYQLSIEPGAAFARQVRRGAITPMEDDPQADLYQITQDVARRGGVRGLRSLQPRARRGGQIAAQPDLLARRRLRRRRPRSPRPAHPCGGPRGEPLAPIRARLHPAGGTGGSRLDT